MRHSRAGVPGVGAVRVSVAVLAALALVVGCQNTNLCKSGTLMVTVTFDGVTSAANKIDVDVTVANGSPKHTTLDHTPGSASGSVEIDFSAGYPEGKQATVTLTASKAGTVLGIRTVMGTTLPKGCGTVTIALSATRDGGAADGSGGGGSDGEVNGAVGEVGGPDGGVADADETGSVDGNLDTQPRADSGDSGGGASSPDADAGPPACTETATRSCKDDAALGNCAKGTETCTGGHWSACGTVPAAVDTCQPGDDANCNGTANDGCACLTGAVRFCSADGAMGTCAKGTESCQAGKWGPCSILPLAMDSCATKGDDANCNGMANDHCPCVSGDTQPCGPPAAVGICKPGVATCTAGQWGACQGAVNKATRNCTSTADNDCDGKPDNTIDTVCQCTIAGSAQVCGRHTGDGTGFCRSGSQTCQAGAGNSSSAWGTCTGSVGPMAGSCGCANGTSQACGNCNGGVQVCTTGLWGACLNQPATPVTYYRDADGDGYGDRNNSKISCSGAPAGYITNNGDCCDTDPIAYPGSGHYSGYPNYGTRAGGCPNPSGQEYDYNCDGVNTKIVAGTYFNLKVITSCNQTLACDSCGCYCNDVQGGWIGSIPACGQSGAFTNCQPGGSSCVETTAQSYVVYCQ